MKTYSPSPGFRFAALAWLGSACLLCAANSNWVHQAVSPASNPLFFEDSHIKSEVSF